MRIAGGLAGLMQQCISALHFPASSPITVPMLAKVCSAAISGIEAYPVEVEVNAGYGDTLTGHFDMDSLEGQKKSDILKM
jgi:hypothetical protein